MIMDATQRNMQNEFMLKATSSRAEGNGNKHITVFLVMFARIAIIFSITRHSNIAPTAERK
jgi:hypothetical protein